MMHVSSPAYRESGDISVLAVTVSLRENDKELWFSTPVRWKQHINASSLDAFLLALLPLAMSQGEDLYLDGPVSERLLYCTNSYLVKLLGLISPDFKSIAVSARETTVSTASQNGLGAATGFSGGVDSFSVLADHLSDRTSPSYRVSTMLFNNVGAVPTQRFFEKWEQLSQITRLTGIDLIPIDSNLGELIDLPFQLTHSMRNAACGLLLRDLYDKYYYASTYSYASTKVEPTYDIAYSDPLSLPLMSTENIALIPTGGQYSRVDKTRSILDFAPAREMLNVCVAANRIDNCSTCWKCGRTLLTLELLGKIESFSSVFDLDHWRRHRSTYIAEYVTNPKKARDPLTLEILELARDTGHTFSGMEKAMGRIAAYLPVTMFRPFAQRVFA